MKAFFVLIAFILTTSYNAQGQKLYGIVGKYFCSHDLSDQSIDTLIEFAEKPSNQFFRSAIDRFNGRYFYGGKLPGHIGNFHIIDLVDLDIKSYPVFPERIEYDYYRQKLVYESNGEFFSLDLITKESTFLGTIENSGGFVWGQTRAFNPSTNQYLHVDYPKYYLIDARSGDVICDGSSLDYPHGLNVNHKNGDFIGHSNGMCSIIVPCESVEPHYVEIPNFQSHLNSQMTVYDQNKDLYIVPYISDEKPDRKIAIVDIYNEKIVNIIDQPWEGGSMNVQQLYDKPMAPPIAQFNDTLFVPKGIRYNWFRDNEYIGTTNKNYWIPVQSGTYKAQVRFREYTTFSCEIQVVLTALEEPIPQNPFRIYPNPVTDNELNISCDSHIDELIITGGNGAVLFKANDIDCNNPIKLEGIFTQGIYFVTILSEGEKFVREFLYLGY